MAVTAAGAVVRDNRLEEVLFGIDLRAAPASRVEANTIAGLDLPLGRRGDAIRVWESDGASILGNVATGARDVVLWYSSGLTVRDNRISEGRYALHFMHCDDAEVSSNLLAGNSVGAYLMYSRRLKLAGNTLVGNSGPSGYGIGLKDMEDVELAGNLLAGNRVGIFLDNSPLGGRGLALVTGNLLAANQVGALLMPNVRGARWIGNDFLDNDEQMALAGGGGDPTGNLWESNFWSDYAGYDGDGDGIGELPYRADRLFERLADRNPQLRLFAGRGGRRADLGQGAHADAGRGPFSMDRGAGRAGGLAPRAARGVRLTRRRSPHLVRPSKEMTPMHRSTWFSFGLTLAAGLLVTACGGGGGGRRRRRQGSRPLQGHLCHLPRPRGAGHAQTG